MFDFMYTIPQPYRKGVYASSIALLVLNALKYTKDSLPEILRNEWILLAASIIAVICGILIVQGEVAT